MHHDFFKKLFLTVTILLLAGTGFTSYLQAGFVWNTRTNETFTTIQDAIDDNDTLAGDTLLVDTDTYTENVIVNKASLTIRGDLSRNQIVDGNGTGHTFRITAEGVTIKYLTIKNDGNYIGVNVEANNSTITGNNFQDCWGGVRIYSNHNIVYDNNFEDCYRGVYLYSYTAVDNVVCHNVISGYENEGILLLGANGNWVYSNTVIGNSNQQDEDYGILLASASVNSIYANDIQDNNYGIYLTWSSNSNIIHHNNFLDNSPYHAYIDNSIGQCSGTQWDKGSSSGGNHWSDVTCTDANNNLICDAAYSIPGGIDDEDGYPLVGYWTPVCGNVNGDIQGNITIGDISYLNDYLVIGPGTPEPIPPCVADVNGDGDVDTYDTDYLVNYLFMDGPAPVANCCSQLVLPWLFINQ